MTTINHRNEAEKLVREWETILHSVSDHNASRRALIDAISTALSAARAEQREADAKTCDVIATGNSRGTFNDCSREVRAAESCATAIRCAGEGRE